MSNRPGIDAEYISRLARAALNDDWKFQPEQRPTKRDQSPFTPMSYDDYHLNGRLIKEPMDFKEHEESVTEICNRKHGY